ncbi:glutathione S-transferase T3-like [Oryza brachyantha]|uniref:glutathione S-transferase T3-like n=1 Tax=Oryza brachyantha TaxID=4533 RepID=UPI001ADA234D|nr:glutathione S-transferase T3-like [Oryza brachyantha]
MVGSSSAQDSWRAPTGIGAPNTKDPDVQAWGADSHPPGGFLDFLNRNIPVQLQGVSYGSSFKSTDVGDDTNFADCGRTRMLWTKDEDRRLVGAWLNNSNDPIHSNYKKNDQYWKEVVAAYNSATPQNRARQLKHIKDRFGRIKKRVV